MSLSGKQKEQDLRVMQKWNVLQALDDMDEVAVFYKAHMTEQREKDIERQTAKCKIALLELSEMVADDIRELELDNLAAETNTTRGDDTK
jgi:hypothetical protein